MEHNTTDVINYLTRLKSTLNKLDSIKNNPPRDFKSYVNEILPAPPQEKKMEFSKPIEPQKKYIQEVPTMPNCPEPFSEPQPEAPKSDADGSKKTLNIVFFGVGGLVLIYGLLGARGAFEFILPIIGIAIIAFRFKQISKGTEGTKKYEEEKRKYEKRKDAYNKEYEDYTNELQRREKIIKSNEKAKEWNEKNYEKAVKNYKQKKEDYDKKLNLYEEEKAKERAEYEKLCRKIKTESTAPYQKILNDYNSSVTSCERALKDLNNEFELSLDSFYYSRISDIIEILKRGRADSLKEALNVLKSDDDAEELKRIREETLEEQREANRMQAEAYEEEARFRREQAEKEERLRYKEECKRKEREWREEAQREKEKRERDRQQKELENVVRCSGCPNRARCTHVERPYLNCWSRY